MVEENKVIALGFFDGVHLGHGALLRRTAQEAARRGVLSAVLTFDRLPREVVTGQPCPLLSTPRDRAFLIQQLYGIDEVIIIPFDREMMTTSWEDFLTELLIRRYRAVHLVAGHDHKFGHKNQGNPQLLQEKCRELGIGCDIIPKVELDGRTVSSTHIRSLIEAGEIEEANRFLGHPHILTETVRHGRRIGHTMGVPTINLLPPARVLTPKFGVYAARVILPGGRRVIAVTNVGVRPTVQNGEDVTVEAHLLDFEGDLYGQSVRMELYSRLRDEVRFSDLEHLSAQIRADEASARAWFQAHQECGM